MIECQCGPCAGRHNSGLMARHRSAGLGLIPLRARRTEGFGIVDALAIQLDSAGTLLALGGAARALAAGRMCGGERAGCLRQVTAGTQLASRSLATGLTVAAATRPQTGIGDAGAQQHGDQHEANRGLRSRHHRIATRGKMNSVWIIVTVPAESQTEPAKKSLCSPCALFLLDAKSCRYDSLPPDRRPPPSVAASGRSGPSAGPRKGA